MANIDKAALGLAKKLESQVEDLAAQSAENVTYQQMPQRPTFTNGEIDGLEYLNPDGSVFRKDTYEFGKDFVIERVTVNGETKSFKYDLNTLEMEVI
ncbi:hypothetical protein J7E55_11935 [Bacillus sp. ISL-53]|nr:hypothetical protein [Bacillus sp. ISL-53]